ncbi:MAG TPA: prohibitin family protein [Puia sp.]|jgi:regulator of protease activity HflC (stomatin/prohibitin superfamily)|nr:prohibitin family protein [Puia sp.]
MKNAVTLCAWILLLFTVAVVGCKTVNPGEVGFVVHKGVIQPGILSQGRHHFNIFNSRIFKFSTRITEYSTIMSPPTKEGLEVKMYLTALFHIKPEAAPKIYSTVGVNYGEEIVINNFMAIVREYTMTYSAVELLGERETIEQNIEDKLRAAIAPYGIVLDDVLVKDIDMPAEVLRAIEDKAKADQVAKLTKLELQTKREQEDFDIETREKELKFALEKQKNDSLVMQIEANAIRNYQLTINSSLTDRLLKYKSIEVTKELVKSPNAKVIITDGKSMMVNNIGEK